MSIANSGNKDRISNPAKSFINWNGEKGSFSYYDKVTKETVEVETIDFVVLDIRSSISGWHEESGSNIYSNFVSNSSQEPFVVKSSKGQLLAEGFYKDIKNDMFKFTNNLFIQAKINGGNWEIFVLNLRGAGLFSWSTYMNDEVGRYNIHDVVTTAVRGEQQKKGRVEYYTPVFTSSPLDAADKQIAIDTYTKTFGPFLEQFAGTAVGEDSADEDSTVNEDSAEKTTTVSI